jgi:hypothetical protein
MAINRNWKDDFGWNDYDDYKSAHIEYERLRQANSTIGWIYIGFDIRHPDEAKIGLTSGELGTRASSAQNPYFALLCAFKIKDGVNSRTIDEIEFEVHRMLEAHYKRINHISSGRKSEWFVVSPFDVRDLVHDFIYNNHYSHMYSYYCHERDMGVINSWENDSVISGGSRGPYQAMDLSNPPVAFECLTPPGCGADCDCW